MNWSDQSRKQRSSLARYAGAFAVVLSAVLLRIAIGPLIGPRFPFALFFLAIAIVARVWGYGPAIFAVAVGTLGSCLMLLKPYHDDHLSSAELSLGMVIYANVGLIIAWLGGRMHSALAISETHAEQLRKRQQELELALNEKQKAEAALRQTAEALGRSEEFHRLITELTSDFAFRAKFIEDGTLVLDYASHGFEAIIGMSLEQLNARGGWATVVEPDDLMIVSRTIDEIRAGKSTQSRCGCEPLTGSPTRFDIWPALS